MLKFITNISCAFNLAVIFMLTSSSPTSDHQITQNNSISITNNAKLDISLEHFINTLKTKYPKLSSFDGSFLNGSVTVFLNQCKLNDVACIAYFDMLLRLADNLTDDSLKSIYQRFPENRVHGDSICAEFSAVLPDAPFSPETTISMKMKDSNICKLNCLVLNETNYNVSVRPICSVTLSGYQYITANSIISIKSPSSTSDIQSNKFNSTVKQLPNKITGVDIPVVANVKNLTITETHDTNAASNVEVLLHNISTDDKLKVNISVPRVPNPIPIGVVLPPAQENVEPPPNKPVVTSDVKSSDIEDKSIKGSPKVEPSDIEDKSNKGNPKVEVNEVKIDQTNNIKTDTEKKADNAVLSSEVNPNVNAPPVDAVTPSAVPFIPNSKIFDGINVPAENDGESEDYNNDDEEGPNSDDDVPLPERSGETAVVRNDMLEKQKLAPEEDAAYGKFKKQEENIQQLDPFTEDTDSNFFTYFMFIMVLCVMLYVVYHNKTKMLALVLEGRRGSNGGRGIGRRKHTAAYRKLDSNLEEAITSNPSGRTTQIIY